MGTFDICCFAHPTTRLLHAGQPFEESQFSYVPASAALQVYGCGVLITIGAALCFSSRQRRHLQSTRVDGTTSSQFITADKPISSSSLALSQSAGEGYLQPLLPEAAV